MTVVLGVRLNDGKVGGVKLLQQWWDIRSWLDIKQLTVREQKVNHGGSKTKMWLFVRSKRFYWVSFSVIKLWLKPKISRFWNWISSLYLSFDLQTYVWCERMPPLLQRWAWPSSSWPASHTRTPHRTSHCGSAPSCSHRRWGSSHEMQAAGMKSELRL